MRITIDPYAVGTISADSTVTTVGIRGINLNELKQIKATFKALGDFGSGTLTVKMQKSANNSSWGDISGGAFGVLSAAGSQSIQFTPPFVDIPESDLGGRAPTSNSENFIRFNLVTADSTDPDIDFRLSLTFYSVDGRVQIAHISNDVNDTMHAFEEI